MSIHWHCIDYIMMRQKNRRICIDVSVKRRAECNMDHQLVCAKLRLKGPFMCGKKHAEEERLFDVTQLNGGRMDDKDEGSDHSMKVLF